MTTPQMLRGLRKNHFVFGAADVPWQYAVRCRSNGLKRSADMHYKTMPLDEIAALPVGDYFAKDARILFWVTGPFLALGAHVPIMRAWGFEPVSTWGVWIKPVAAYYQNPHGVTLDDHLFEMNLGFTSRQNAEFVIEGRRGNPPERKSKRIRQVFLEPAREHSRKPEKFYQMAEAYADGPRLELFGRQQRPNWTVRGDESEKYR
jgi:N6-adenosine-specific RNA methylase IME4